MRICICQKLRCLACEKSCGIALARSCGIALVSKTKMRAAFLMLIYTRLKKQVSGYLEQISNTALCQFIQHHSIENSYAQQS